MPTAEQTGATILVVDDTEFNVDIVLKILEGYDVIPCTSGTDALALLRNEPVDLVLLDIMMPVMDGFEVCRRLKADPLTRDIPIIFITAKDDEQSIETAYEIGGYDYVTKPIKPRELQARVQTQLTLYRQYRRLREQNLDLSRAENDLKASNQRYQSALETALDGFWVLDPTGRIVEVNDAYCRISGFSRDELLAMRVCDLEAVESDLEVSQHIAKLMRQGNDLFETRHRRKDGSTWAVEVSVSYSPVQGGRIFTFLRDIRERKQSERLTKLRQQLAELVYGVDLEQLMQTALDTAEQMTGSAIGFYHFVEQDQETVSLQVWSTRTLRETGLAEGRDMHNPVSQAGVWGDCIRQRRPVMHNDYAALPHKKGLLEGHPLVTRELTVPVFREGRIVAVMGVGNKPGDYDTRDQEIVNQVADMTHDFVERKRIEQRIEYMAFNDVLTGLPNRELLRDRLRQAISLTHRSKRLLAVCFLDLDGFKPVNDQYGHHLGDTLLVRLGQRLSEGLREGDTLARLGGDEFVILLNGLTSIFDGEGIIGRILASINQPFEIDDQHIQVSGSIGVTFYPTDDTDPDTLMRHADQAMYKAKEAGKSTFRLFDPVQEQEIRDRRQSLEELEQALISRQLELFYQPRVDLGSGETISTEALLRWRHPKRGLLLPGDFLQLVDGTPLEVTLGEWVLKRALDQHMDWRHRGLKIPVSVNISPRHIRLAGFTTFLQRLLSGYPKDIADNLELEILETTAIGDTEDVSRTMDDCARLGVHFALDDFGTGYASLTHFHRLPIDVLKIDQNFVKDMLDDDRDLDIVEGVLRLAYGLKRPVVAEGVESVEIGMMLLQLGCRYAQGFGIAEPMPAADMAEWLAGWSDANIWHRLRSEATGLPANYDLNVSIFTHRLWLDGIAQFIRSGEAEDLPILDGSKCQFERWYRGIGLIRYGDHPSYPFIPSRHSKVHELANSLVAQAKAGEWERSRAGLTELKSVSAELIDVLHQLQNE